MGLPLIFSPPHALLRWASAGLDGERFGGTSAPVGILRGGELAAVCVYHRFHGVNCEVSFASVDPRWATRQVLTFIIAYPFLTWPHLRRMTAVARHSNKRSRRLLEGIGARCEGLLADMYPDENGIQYAITRRWWERSRWYTRPVQQQEAA
jgi:RimJ/RimL family protein N-acetyltransferase